jgi:two-component system, chemotaxis family, chemotaxis protein CheY
VVVKRILLVEDSATTRALIRAIIDELGEFEVVEASTGFEALKILPSQECGLIITDINMPDINGLELISFVRNNEKYNELPIIIVSTERSEEDRRRGMALGATAYLAKPFTSSELQEIIKNTVHL